jgi:hypothetical protein
MLDRIGGFVFAGLGTALLGLAPLLWRRVHADPSGALREEWRDALGPGCGLALGRFIITLAVIAGAFFLYIGLRLLLG